MVVEEPEWTFSSKRPLTQWYGHVQLLPNDALGQWFCVDRRSGALRWQRVLFRPNTICGVDSGVIVASETRSDGPWTADIGCYGISLDDGRLLWISHGSGVWGWLGRLLDFVPGYTNEFRDAPHHITDGKVFCYSGRILDVRTGWLLERTTSDAVMADRKPRSLAQQFYDSGDERERAKIAVGKDLVLYHAAPEGSGRRNWEIAAEIDSGQPLWRISASQLGRQIDGNFYSYRLVPPFMYLVVSDEPRYRPHPTKKPYALPNPTRWHLMTVDLATGVVVQDFSLDDRKLAECRIEDVDDHGLLIGKSNRELAYFRRTP